MNSSLSPIPPLQYVIILYFFIIPSVRGGVSVITYYMQEQTEACSRMVNVR